MEISKQHIFSDWEKFEQFRLKKQRGLKTGFKEIDRLIIGMPGLVTLMGDTGCGKSTFTLNIIVHNAQQGNPVILVDKENGLQRTRLRLVSLLGGIIPEAIESNNWQGKEKEQYEHGLKQLQALPLYYYDNAERYELEQMINEVGKKHKKHVLVVIDSLNRVVRGGESKKDDIDAWMTELNNLKIKYDNHLTFLVICEKSKSQYGAASTKGAKDSGEIDYIGEMHLDMYPNRDKRSVVLECLKNRDGPKGVLTVLTPDIPFTYKIRDTEYLPE